MKKTQNSIANEMRLQIKSLSRNESFARSAVSAFIAQYDPELTELTDIRTAVSEAVTNCVIHGYGNNEGVIYISVKVYENRTVKISIKDHGCGIADINKAREPLYTSDTSGERGGMGFAIMESFTDKLTVSSKVGKGTTVVMTKCLSS